MSVSKEWNADVGAKMVVGVGKFALSLTRKASYYSNHLTASCRMDNCAVYVSYSLDVCRTCMEI